MATGRKTLRWLRGAAASALAALTLVVVTQSPAHAEGEVTVGFNPPSAAVQIAGEGTTVNVTLTPTNPAASYEATVRVTMSGLDNIAGVEVGGGANCPTPAGGGIRCTLPPGQAGAFQLSIAPSTRSSLKANEQRSGSVAVDVSLKESTTHQPGHAAGSLPVTVTGNASGVPVVKGVVSDDLGKPVSGVELTLTDGEKQTFTTKSDGQGNYQIAGTANKPIKPGEMSITGVKEGFADTTKSFNGIAGQEAKMNFSLEKKTEESAGESAAPPPTATAAPVAEEKDSGWSASTWFLVILGVLFVGGGIAAIVLLLKRGKKDEEDEDLFSDKPPAHTPKAAQTGLPGVYDAGPRRPMMDAPTMIHNGPLIDDDDLARYGSGATSPGFGPAYGAGGDDQQRTQMFDPRGNDPVSGQPTQMFDPRTGGDAGGYRSPGYGEPDRGGYGQGGAQGGRGGYDGPQQDRGGYDRPYSSPPADSGYGRDDRGYGPPPPMPPSQGGYGHDDRGGYGPPPSQGGGYDQGRQQQQPYERPYSSPPAPPAQPSYEQDPRYDTRRDDRAGYDERYAPPPPPPAPPADPGYGRDERYDDRGYDDRPRW